MAPNESGPLARNDFLSFLSVASVASVTLCFQSSFVLQRNEAYPDALLASDESERIPPGEGDRTMVNADVSTPSPDFEQWVDCWFASFDDESSDEDEVENLKDRDEAEYCARLFEHPAFLAEKFNRQQLTAGFWRLCGVEGVFRVAMDPSVPDLERQRWIRAIGTLYTDLFDPLCVSVPYELCKTDSFCGVVFMLWDMDSLDLAQTIPELQEDCLSVLDIALHCQSAACMTSGLHGIGHWIQLNEIQGETEFVEPLRGCIDEFLLRYRQQPQASQSLIQYALDARRGCVL